MKNLYFLFSVIHIGIFHSAKYFSSLLFLFKCLAISIVSVPIAKTLSGSPFCGHISNKYVRSFSSHKGSNLPPKPLVLYLNLEEFNNEEVVIFKLFNLLGEYSNIVYTCKITLLHPSNEELAWADLTFIYTESEVLVLIEAMAELEKVCWNYEEYDNRRFRLEFWPNEGYGSNGYLHDEVVGSLEPGVIYNSSLIIEYHDNITTSVKPLKNFLFSADENDCIKSLLEFIHQTIQQWEQTPESVNRFLWFTPGAPSDHMPNIFGKLDLSIVYFTNQQKQGMNLQVLSNKIRSGKLWKNFNSLSFVNHRSFSTSMSSHSPHQSVVNIISKTEGNLYNSSTDMLNMFNARLKKDNHASQQKVELGNNFNYIGKPRHYPPANKEWFNSIYVYNNKTIKLLPSLDKVILKLVKSYFNLYSRKLEKKIKSRRLRIRGRRLSTNRILTSRAELKHTNDKVIVTIYVYNRQKKYFFNKIISIARIGNLIPHITKVKVIKEKSSNIKSRVEKQKELAWKTLGLFSSNKKKVDNNKFKNYETSYLKNYVTRSLRKEMLSVYLWQLVSFNESKFEKKYLLPLTSLVNKVYNKKVEFNLVNLKYLYLNSYIFSETLVTKLRNRKNRLLRVLKTSLLMFKLPSIDRLALYEEIYNRKRKLQNIKVDNTTANFISLKSNIKSQFNDLLEGSLLNTDPKGSIYKLKDFKLHRLQKTYYNYPLFILSTVIKSIRNKYVSGIRLEVAGRLTRRNKAARSLFKLRYKGNIRNMDSSYKGLSAVLLRGYAKSNLQYTKLKSRIRIGSYGLKGWVSSS